ncbi:uncharacterized protein LOC113346939 isoform X2 [Papaver somniferum]|uniref:uncharacterized protein LOC113346939 isoform X2 n=1 Tax=Papaver somniferum TaxID=3469 RepID=UPI000E6FD9FB|nr:uncharacterized protein LOC113346939 isoform X2 [Papaver somniferum]
MEKEASEISSVIITRRIQPSTQYETLGGAESHDEVWDGQLKNTKCIKLIFQNFCFQFMNLRTHLKLGKYKGNLILSTRLLSDFDLSSGNIFSATKKMATSKSILEIALWTLYLLICVFQKIFHELLTLCQFLHLCRIYQITHTSLGDINIKLYPEKCSKTMEKLTTGCSNGYY